MTDILITGATGFVGSHLVDSLGRQGVAARALVRETSDLSTLERFGMERVVGHLGDPESLRRAVDGVETVMHLAAATRALRPATFHEANGEGTRRLVEALEGGGGRPRLIYLSSMAAPGPAGGPPVGPEDEPRPLTAYGRSKLEGERHALDNVSVRSVVLRPPAVYGPRDRDLLPFFRLASHGLLLAVGDAQRRVQLVHVADLVVAIEKAWRTPAATGIFHIAEPTVYTWAEVLDRMATAVGRRGMRVPVAAPVVRAAARVRQVAARATGRPAIFDQDKALELLADGWICETDRARRELGFEAKISLGDGFRETAAWYRERGWL